MEFLIRSAKEEDRDALGALKLRSSLAWGDHVEELKALPEARQFPAEHLPYAIIGEVDGVLVGFITIVPTIGCEAELEDLFVAPEAWRTGVGRNLVAEAESRAKALGVGSLHVVAGERARPFYEALGFQFIGTIATKFSLAVEMRKLLP
ncbi:GNAT family N-acetyltransferase [Labrys neptuniae]